MTYAFGIYFEDDDNLGLVAAGNRWTSGGNSAMARRLRVAMQRRDRYGRWAEMGGGISFKGRFGNTGQVMDAVGRYVGPAEREGYMRVYVTSGRGLQPGVYEVPSKVATVAKALLTEEALKDVGVKLDVNGNQVGDVLDRDIEFFAGMFKGKPTDFELDMARGKVSKSEQKTIVKARLKAPAHKSYNIVDKNGKRVDKDEVPSTPDVKKPSKKAKPAQKFPLPDLSKLDPKDRSRLEYWVGPDGKRLKDGMVTDAIKADPKNYRVRTKDGVLDGNGELVEFNPTFKPEANPLPTREEDKVVLGDDGFVNANNVRPGEVRKDITNAQELYEHLYNGGFAEVPIELALEALAISKADSQYLGRSKNPYINTHDSRDPKFVEIASKLESLSRWQQNRLERAISLALMDEKQLDDFNAWLDNNLEEGILLTDEQLVDAHKKFRNLGVDITNVRAKGTDVFTNDNLGALRRDMPQLDDPDQPEFLAELKRLGIKFTDERVNVKELKPIQAEMDMGSVAFLEEKFADPESRKGFDSKRLVVTKDGYILDGHHRYAAAYLASLRTGEPIELNIVRLDLDHEDALKIANEWNDHAGIFRQQIGGQFEAKPRPEAPKAEIPVAPRQPVDLMLNRAPKGPSGKLGPDGSPLENWLDSQLKNNGDLIRPQFADRLTEDKPNLAEPQSPHPGSKTVLKNLLKYRDALRAGLLDSALDNNSEEFKLKFEIAKRVSTLLNQIYDNYVNGRDYTKDIEIALSTSNPDEKLKAFRILPNSLVTEVDNNGIKIIKTFDSITIGKNGVPFVLRWKRSQDGGGTSTAYKVKPDGSVDFQAAQNSEWHGGGLSFGGSQRYTVDANGNFMPEIATVGGAFTDRHHQALGLMSGHIFLTRWVQTQFMENGRLSHSGHLYAPGNFYSKTVSKDMRDHSRSQVDKAVHQNNPNGDIFKVLKAMGLVGGRYVAYDKNATDNEPGGGGANSGGSGWLRRITPVNQSGHGSNQSVLTNYSPIDTVTQYARTFASKSDAEKQAILAAMPEIFRDYFGGDHTRPGWQKYKNFDVQYELLGTVYSDGMKKEEASDFLDKIITGLPQLHQAFGYPASSSSVLESKLKALKDAIDAHQWDQANNNYNRPKSFNTNSIRVLESPFAGNFKFSQWNVGRDIKRIINELPFTPAGKPAGAPVHWTENPTELELRFSPETLLKVLTSSLKDDNGNVAHLPEDRNGNGPMDVNPTAVYKALENGGYDTEKMLAEIYDDINGNSANLDALMARRAELGNLNDIIAKLSREVGVLEEPVVFSQIGGDYNAADQILQSDLVKRGWENVDGNPALDLKDLEPVNETYVDANRLQIIEAAPYQPQIPNRQFYTAGIADNPKIIARNFSPRGLSNALTDAIQNNRRTVKLKFPNGQELEVPNSAIRDALQHQGYDINKVLSEIPGINPKPKTPYQIASEASPSGDNIRNWTGLGVADFSDNATVIYENSSADAGVPNGNTYEIGLANGTMGQRETFIAKLAKIQKNADGKYEVWIAKKKDNFVGEFTGTPDGVYSSFSNALFDVQKHAMVETNISRQTGVGNNFASEPSRLSFLSEHAIIDDNSPDSIEVAGMRVSRPDNVGTTKVFENSNGIKRINNTLLTGTTLVYSLNSNPNANNGNEIESLVRHTTDADGNQIDTPIYAISKPVAADLPDKYAVRLFGALDSNGNVAPSQIVYVSDLEVAKNIARRHSNLVNKEKLVGVNDDNNAILTSIASVPASALVDEKQNISDRATRSSITKVKLPGGIEANLTITVKKGAHPAWRRGVPDSDNRYVYATATLSSPDGSENYGSFEIVRTAIRRWSLIAKPSPLLSGNNNPYMGNLPSSNYWNDKEDAFGSLKLRVDRHFLGQNPDGKTLFPEDRIVNVATPAQNAIDPNAPVVPSENFLSDSKFSDFVTERGQTIDLTGAVRQGGMGLGASHSEKYELNGKKYKVKTEGSDKARQESFNHAIYKLTGVQVTEARIATNLPGQQPNTIVLADEFEPNIVPGNTNGHMSGKALFRGANFTDPQNQQAIADMQEGLLMDALTGNGDMAGNAGNSFVAVRDGVRRGVRCDNGSGGLYTVIGGGRTQSFVNGNGADRLKRDLGNFMAPGASITDSNNPGSLNRGLTKDAVLAIARRTILPLTDDKIDSLVNSIMSLPADRADLALHLKRRRLEILNYLGIDPNEEPPQGTAARVPSNIPGNILPTLANDGYEYEPANANGIPRIRVNGAVNANGVFVASRYDDLPTEVKSQLLSGKAQPAHLPFMSHDSDRPSLVVDGSGIVRPIGKNGMTSIFIRKRKADGTYEYLYIKQGANGNVRMNGVGTNANQLMPIVHNNNDGPDTPLNEMLASEGFAGIPIVGSKEMRLAIPGLGQDHRIIVADIGSEDISGVLSRASQNNVTSAAAWKVANRLNVASAHYYDQLNGNNDKNDVVNKLQEWERTWSASPSPEPSADNDGGVGGNGDGPSAPNGGDNGPADSGSSSTDNGWAVTRSMALRGPGGEVGNNGGLVFHGHPNGGVRVFDSSSNELQGEILPTYHGHWVATFMPNDIDNANRENRNGRAIKGIFSSKEDAENWLAKKVYDKYGVPSGAEGNRRPFSASGRGDYNPNAAPYVEIAKGFLNPTTDNQRRLADRLVDHKKATSEERALFRAMLTQDNLTVGEVGWVINKLKNREDRDNAELAESRRVREEAAAANPIQPSSLEAPALPQNVVPVVAKNLRPGHRILGKVNGNVVFTAEGENNTINVGVVKDDGKLYVYKVGRNTVIGCDNQQVAPAANVNVPTHPVIQQRRAQARLIQDQLKALYPNHRELPNGDLIVGQRDHRQANGEIYRYEAVVHKLKSDEFISYVRKQQIDTNGNPVGQARASYLTVPGHSPKAVKNRLAKEVIKAVYAANPANGFNQTDHQPEVTNPATGLPLPASLVDQNAQYIGTTGIEKTGNATKDALISYVQNLVARGLAQPEIIDQVIGRNQNIFSRHQMDDIIERLEWNRQFPGTNAIPYVSKDNKTIVRVGDRVTHYDADGNPKLMENGQPRTGVVTERRPYTLNRKPNGDYEYTDQLYVQWDDTNRPHQAAARRLEVNRRADGTAPVPAVQGPNEGGNNNPAILPMPFPRTRPGQQPVAPPTDSDLQDIANIGNVRIVVVPNGPTYQVERDNNGTQFKDVQNGGYSDIYVIERNGKWAVKKMDGVDRQTLVEFDTRNEAEAHAMDIITGNNAPATPAGQPVAENVAQRGTLINSTNIGGFDRVVDPSGMGHTITRGANMTRFDKDQGDWQDDAIFVHLRADGKWHVVQQIPDGNGGHTVRSVAINDDRNMSEAIATNFVAGNSTPEEYMRMWGNPNQPNAPENNDSVIGPLIERFNANRMPYGYKFARDGGPGRVGNGNPITLRDERAAAQGLGSVRGRISQDENSDFIVQKWDNNNRYVGQEEHSDVMTALEVLSSHALALKLERENNNSPESNSPSSSSPTSPNGGDGGVPPNNPPAGGDGGASEGPGLDLQPGRWRQGEPPQGVVRIGGVVPKVNTFWDDDQPPTRYDVVRSDNGTKFIGRGGDNPGAEAFINVEKTRLGNWRVVDPRERGDARYSAEYGDRNVAEAIAINKMAGRQELNRDILNQPDPNVAPAPAPSEMLKQEAIDLDPVVRNFVNSGRGNLIQVPGGLLATGTNGEGIASLRTPNVDGEQFIVTNLRNNDQRGFSSKQEAVVELGNMLRAYQDEQGFDRVNLDATPQQSPVATDSESPESGNSDSELRVGEFRAPDGMIEERDSDGNFSADFSIGNKTFQRTRTPNGRTSYKYKGLEIASIEKNSDGTFNVRNFWAKDDSDFIIAKDEATALQKAQSDIWHASQDGKVDQLDKDIADGNADVVEPGTPIVPEENAPATPARPNLTPAVPATPGQPKPEVVPEFAPPGYKANGQMNVGGGVGGQNDFRDITPQPQEGAILRQHQPQNIGGDYNPGFYWENPDGTVAEWDFNRDGKKFMRPTPVDRREPDNSGVRYQPGDVFDPNYRPDGNNNGGTPPTGPSDNGGGGGGVPPTNNPPAGPAPAPAAPEAEPTQAPQGKPRVNEVQPGDRYVRYNSRRNDKPGGERTHWDIYDKRTGKIIARATEKEVADDIAAGVRDVKGNLIDFNTPVAPRGGRRAPNTPANQAPAPTTGKLAPNHQRNDLGSDMFTVSDGNNEYGVAEKIAPNMWSIRLHENPRDAIGNRNRIFAGSYDTAEQAEAAIRKAIADRQAQRDAANVLQWQSGSDGKQYLGLDGVAGVDAENAPVYGISPSPFGGWALARWDSKASKDAGAQPNSIVAQPDEEAAKNDALKQINDFLRMLTGQNPPLVNDENPTTPNGNGNENGPEITPESQSPLYTPFNPNA